MALLMRTTCLDCLKRLHYCPGFLSLLYFCLERWSSVSYTQVGSVYFRWYVVEKNLTHSLYSCFQISLHCLFQSVSQSFKYLKWKLTRKWWLGQNTASQYDLKHTCRCLSSLFFSLLIPILETISVGVWQTLKHYLFFTVFKNFWFGFGVRWK